MLTSPSGKRHWIFALLAIVAIASQLVVAVSPLAEGHDGRMVSHIESHGTPSHYRYNEATCAACQARSIHGTTSRQSAPVVAEHQTVAATSSTVLLVAAGDHYPQDNPRAPPSVI